MEGRENIKWKLRRAGYVRVDVDGSVFHQNQAVCGGVARDDQGNWLRGLQQDLGYAPSTAAELLAIRSGLRMYKDMNFSQVQLSADSLEAIQLLLMDSGDGHPLSSETQETRMLIFSTWDIEIRHTCREALKCVDYLTKSTHGSSREMRPLSTGHRQYCVAQVAQDVLKANMGAFDQM
ncbi:uncharacterized protein LOC114723408 [Neltuma alba]|uniref:uncharacterized protein LOC114723408 n=1 Tax=Neltuma alba TaxID=207710 RepID=UPI0010A416A9|nr:uncharacterized protein LOC114723408 [Prosopis alba]